VLLEDEEMPQMICIEIPREVIHATRMNAQELKRELAVHLFQQGKLSFGKAREMAGMTVWAFQQLLGSREIAVHYDIEDYEEDLIALEDLDQP
jgi:predicted HTH domain antitoxin